jgi:hypothetical protein
MPPSMTFKRLLPCAIALLSLTLVSSASAQDNGGGAVAAPQAVAPQADAAQTPTTPEGEEQPPQEQPDGEQPPTAEPLPETPSQVGAGGESTGGLPATGWQAFALASIGLGLLLAGAALRPTSSWPPPRDRLIR